MDDKTRDILRLAREYGDRLRAYQARMRACVDHAAPMDVEDFWPLIDALGHRLAIKGADGRKVTNDFIRSHLFDGAMSFASADQRAKAWEQMVSFAHTYGKVKQAIRRELRGFDLDMSDDSFEDFCDSFAFAGRATVERLMSGKLPTSEAVLGAAMSSPLRRFIMGENYVEMTLVDAIIEYGPAVAFDCADI